MCGYWKVGTWLLISHVSWKCILLSELGYVSELELFMRNRFDITNVIKNQVFEARLFWYCFSFSILLGGGLCSYFLITVYWIWIASTTIMSLIMLYACTVLLLVWLNFCRLSVPLLLWIIGAAIKWWWLSAWYYFCPNTTYQTIQYT